MAASLGSPRQVVGWLRSCWRRKMGWATLIVYNWPEKDGLHSTFSPIKARVMTVAQRLCCVLFCVWACVTCVMDRWEWNELHRRKRRKFASLASGWIVSEPSLDLRKSSTTRALMPGAGVRVLSGRTPTVMAQDARSDPRWERQLATGGPLRTRKWRNTHPSVADPDGRVPAHQEGPGPPLAHS